MLAHDDIVTSYARAFERFALAAEYMSRGCCYLDRINTSSYSSGRNTTTNHSGKYRKQNVEALALLLWKSNVLFTIRDRYQNKLFYQVFEWIRQDRDGDDAPHSTIKSVVTSLVQVNSFTEQPLQLYIEEFERPYLVHTKRYYEAEAAREIASGSISSFMQKANERLQQEIMRNNQYCHSTSHGRILSFSNNCRLDCTLAYTLLSRIPEGLKPILDIYENYVAKLGKDIVSRLGSSVTKNPRSYVDQLLNLHSKYYHVNHQVFSSDSLFTASVDKAFRTIINDTLSPTAPANGPETLARYCDMMMKKNAGKRDINSGTAGAGSKRKGIKKPIAEMDEGDQEERLMKIKKKRGGGSRKAVTLFKYVDDKDVFQKFYSRMLAKRLIYGASSSEELELNMINRLKEICGVEYTSKLNKMFTDMSLSSDLNTNVSYENVLYIGLVNMDILVLTAGAWPLNQKDDAGPDTNKLQIPSLLENNITAFEDFYGHQYNGRRLLWQWNLTRGEIRINYLDKNYELQVSLYQMVILLLFNQGVSLPVTEIVNQSGLSLADTMKSLKPLIDTQVLEISNQQGAFSSSSELNINGSFTSKRTKIKVPAAASQNESQQESQAARKSVDEDRRMYLQAAIVRIMKSRQVLPHVQLIQEIIDQANSRFSPSVIMIKKCIEQLLEKQFIARQERDTYVYVA
ncbi:Cullin [Parasitella parasitica]|nr:Cullin [Parasitella parasitica]